MAEVFEADAVGEAGFVRRVAIKRMLSTALEDPALPRMFMDEARIASRLHHASIVGILDYGIADGAPFQVLEYVEGIDARKLVRASGGRVPEDVALYIVGHIGHALAAAHEAVGPEGQPLGIVHRDVSPANILVSWGGDVKLADFGIAFAKERSEKTEAGMMKGTLLFMSPEQAIGGPVDGRSDVFSLGCVLHTLVTGTSPLAGEAFTRFLLDRVLVLSDALSPGVREIVEMATRYEPQRRFQSARALAEASFSALSARLSRDPRGRVIEHLAPMREEVRVARGRVDGLLHDDIVRDEADPTLREFHTATLVDRTSAAPSRARGWALLALASVLVGTVGTAGVLVGRRRLARATPPAPVVRPSSEPVAEPVVSASPALATPSPTPLSSPAAESKPRRAAPIAVAPSAAAGCTGTLYLSCPLAPRAAISIDGARTAHHHGEFVEVACGTHRVSFTMADGREVTRKAAPTSASSRTAPIEVRCGLDGSGPP